MPEKDATESKATTAKKTTKRRKTTTKKKPATRTKRATKTVKKEKAPKAAKPAAKTAESVMPDKTFSAKPLFQAITTIVVLLGILVLIIGLSQLGKKDDKQARLDMVMQNMASEAVQTMQFRGDIKIDPGQGQPQGFRLDFQGQADLSNPDEIKQYLDFHVDLAGLGIPGTPSVNLGMIMHQNDLYMRLSGISSLEDFGMPGLDHLFNSWVHADLSQLAELTGGQAIGNIDISRVMTLRNNVSLTKGMFVVKEDLGQENQGGREVAHYLVNIDKEHFSRYLRAYYHELGVSQEIVDEALNDEQLMQTVDLMNQNGIDLWFDDQNFITRMHMDFGIPQELNGQEGMSIRVNINYEKYNQPVTIDRPEEYIELQQLIDEFTQSLQEPQSQVQALLEGHTLYEEEVTQALTLTCDDITFDSEDGNITRLWLTTVEEDEDPTDLDLFTYITPGISIDQETYLSCQSNKDYVPAVIDLPDGSWVWTPKSYWEEDGPCGDVSQTSDDEESTPEQIECIQTLFDLQAYVIDRLPGLEDSN